VEHRKLSDERNRLERFIEQCFTVFKQRWPAESADLDTTLASAQDFLAKLKRLEVDGLPQYEERFFDLLKEQSNQNLASLNTQLRQARNEIRERVELVNESLKHAEFNEGTRLRIEVSDRALPEVQEFKREVHEALSHAWTDNREIAEDRFRLLSKLVERMSNQDPHERRWRDAVLDVRQATILYWGDIDTHGFAILSRARSCFPHLKSMMMDEATLLRHRDLDLCVEEPMQHGAQSLPNLTMEELAVYRNLQQQIWGFRLRLEQERISWPEAWGVVKEAHVRCQEIKC
jgi:hypothetical protein